MRNKVVGIELGDDDTLIAHGILDDDIYSVELDVAIRLSDMMIVSIEGRFKRWTTPECPKAIAVLQDAVGFSTGEPGFPQKVQKNIGRKGCRHFATLLVECASTAEKAAYLIRGKESEKKRVKKSGEEGFFGEGKRERIIESAVKAERGPEAKGEKKNTVIDLHVHTYPASSCSGVRVEQVVEEAKRIGLDGICLTDHNYLWDPAQVEELAEKHGFPIFTGNEITTDQGDVIVLGLDVPIQGIIRLDELRDMVMKAKGFMIAAHPFRGFLLFGTGQLGLTAEKARTRPLFKWVDAVEVLNGRVTEKENTLALEVAKGLGLSVTGGSDAHQASEVGLCTTQFPGKVGDDNELIEALKTGNYSPAPFRGK